MTGKSVIFVDSHGVEHDAIVTAVHGAWGPESKAAINLVYVSDDEARTDGYGRQIERATSVVHRSNQSANGYFWRERE